VYPIVSQSFRMIHDVYQTIAVPSEGIYKDKGSKFLSFAFPIKNEDEIKDIMAKIKKEHFSARHCCFAWSLGANRDKHRFNDDGEPSGTAGRPIYAQLLSHELTYILIVVVRYFGGTLLGVSGLIQAYKKAAADAIGNSTIITRHTELFLSIEFDYLAMNNLMQLVKDHSLDVISSDFNLKCSILLKIRKSQKDILTEKIEKMEGYISRHEISEL
jgi:uncharacterized YigZ family protein